MMTPYKRLSRFHKLMAAVPDAQKNRIDFRECTDTTELVKLVDLRLSLIEEEFSELKEAMESLKTQLNAADNYPDKKILALDVQHSLTDMLDAICDLNVVTIGTAEVFGMDYTTAFEDVMDNNETKCGEGAHFRKDGKLLKPESYQPVNLRSLANEEAISAHVLRILD